MKKFLILFCACLLWSFDLVDYSLYQKDDMPSKIKSSFIYNFAKSFQWPDSNNDQFSIAILGENTSLLNYLNEMSSTKMIGTKKITVKKYNSISEITKPEILYILQDKSSSLADAVTKFKGKGTLLITEKQGSANAGAAINFVIENNNIKFELNKTSAGKAGLVVSSKIETMALKVF